MKKYLLLILGIVFILIVAAFCVYSYNLGLKKASKPIPKQIEDSLLVGIWQASGSMASGWNDRYHFYAGGKFHFYPSQMECVEESEELLGSWENKENELILTVKSEIKDTFTCDLNGFGHLVNQKVVDLQKPEVKQFSLVNLKKAKDDFYPSILLKGNQFWQFSKDPTSYGNENFPQE